MHFFRRLMEQGRVFIWCEEAVVFEAVPPSRCRLSYLFKRALMRGSTFHKHPVNRMKNTVKSLIAFPTYISAIRRVARRTRFCKILDQALRSLVPASRFCWHRARRAEANLAGSARTSRDPTRHLWHE